MPVPTAAELKERAVLMFTGGQGDLVASGEGALHVGATNELLMHAVQAIHELFEQRRL